MLRLALLPVRVVLEVVLAVVRHLDTDDDPYDITWASITYHGTDGM